MYYDNQMEETLLQHVELYYPRQCEILPMEIFQVMDDVALDHGLEVPMMMEMAGYQMARLVYNQEKPASVVVGVGPDNNGGGGLVAARKLKGWGLDVSLHIPSHVGNQHFHDQLNRCMQFGVSTSPNWQADVFIDAYLGSSQYFPLSDSYKNAVKHANQLKSRRYCLDLPTGFASPGRSINADVIVTLAAAKTDLVPWLDHAEIYVADIGIPFSIYRMFGFKAPIPFSESGLAKWANLL